MNLKHGGEVYLAYIFEYSDSNLLLKLWNKRLEVAKFDKHNGKGKTIRRRARIKEVKHGQAKSAVTMLHEIKMLATSMKNQLTHFDVDYSNIYTRMEAKRILSMLDITDDFNIIRKYQKKNKI